MINMGKYAKKLTIHMLYILREGWREVLTCKVSGAQYFECQAERVCVPDLVGNMFSSSRRFCTHVITKSTYVVAGS